jgi:sigma-E factor negative regulatory protein RseC
MNTEMLVEEGIVVSSQNGFAEVSVTKSEHCEECSAKIICKPSNKDSQLVKVIDPFNTHPGDKVKIAIKGTMLLKSSFKIYGIPLILLLASIFLSNTFLNSTQYKDLYSFLIGIIITTGYYVVIFLSKNSNQKLILPTIISCPRD